MTDCKGLFGKLFGHNFEKYLIKRTPGGDLNLSNCYGSDLEKLLDHQTEYSYEIRCKRCGCKADE